MANKQFTGGAVAVRDTWTITVAGTWASADSVDIQIGNKNLIVTMGASASTAVGDIAAEIANAINGLDNATPGTGFTWNYGGQEFPEFQEVAATVNGAVVTVRAIADRAGVPIGLTVTETTAGDGTATESNTVPATGPEFLDNADNYADGSLPADDDTLYFNTGAVSAKYGLTYFRANSIDLNVIITNDWSGQLGLAAYNVAGGYHEYRQRYFQFRGGSKTLSVEPGLLAQSNVGNLWIDLQDQAGVIVNVSANRGSSVNTPTIYLAGAHASTLTNELDVVRGAVSIEPDEAGTDASKYAAFGEIRIGTVNGAESDAAVWIGGNARLSSGTLEIHGGTVTTAAPTNTSTATNVRGGRLRLISSGTHGAFDVGAGAVLDVIAACTLGAVELFAGTLDTRNGTGVGTFTAAVTAHAGASIYDPAKRFPSTYGLTCQISELSAIDLGPDRILVVT